MEGVRMPLGRRRVHQLNIGYLVEVLTEVLASEINPEGARFVPADDRQIRAGHSKFVNMLDLAVLARICFQIGVGALHEFFSLGVLWVIHEGSQHGVTSVERHDHVLHQIAQFFVHGLLAANLFVEALDPKHFPGLPELAGLGYARNV